MNENAEAKQLSTNGLIAVILLIVATAMGSRSGQSSLLKFSEGANFLRFVAFGLGLAGAALLVWYVLCPARRLQGMMGGWFLVGMSLFSIISIALEFEIFYFLPALVELGATVVLAVWMLLIFGGRNHAVVGKLWFLPAAIEAGALLFALIGMIVAAFDAKTLAPDASFCVLLCAALLFFGLFMKEEVAKMPPPAPKQMPMMPNYQQPYDQLYAQQDAYPYAQQQNPYLYAQQMPAQPVQQEMIVADGAELPVAQGDEQQNV